MTRLPRVAIVVLVLVLAASCNRRPQGTAETSAATSAEGSAAAGVSGEESGAYSAVSASPAAATDRPEVTPATRPDALLRALPRGAVTVALDLDALSVWAAVGPAPEGAAERARGVAEQAVVALVAEYAPDAGLRLGSDTRAAAWTWTPSGLALAVAAPPDELRGGTVEQLDGVTLVRFGTPIDGTGEVPSGLPATAAATLIVRDASALPERVANALDFLAPLGVTSLVAGIGADGTVDAVLEAADPEQVHTALGAGQAFVSQALGQLRGETSPSMQGWVTYANRATQAAFARVAVEVGEGRAALHVPPPSCGGPFRNLAAVAFVLAAADVAVADARTPRIPYVPMRAEYADDCGPVDGAVPGIPASVARFGTHDGDRRAVLVVVDLPGLLRTGLPTAFGLLPFALPDATIVDAFGERPMGLSGLTDPAGHVVFARDRGDGETSPAQQALVLPASLASLIDPAEPIDTLAPFVTPDLVGYATPGFDPTGRAARTAAPTWERAIDLLPTGTVAAAVLNGAIVGRWAQAMAADDPLRPVVGAVETVVIAWHTGGLSVGLVGVPPGVQATAVREGLPRSVASIARPTAPAAHAEDRLRVARDAVDVLGIRVVDDVVWLEATGGMVPLVAAAARVGLPMLAGTSGRGHVGIPVAPVGLPFPQPPASGRSAPRPPEPQGP